MSSSATSTSINSSSSSPSPFYQSQYFLSIFLLLLSTFLFFRSILPRIPRLFLRGPLRVKRVGLRGIRGIEWRSNGFPSNSNSAECFNGERDYGNDGLIVRIQQIQPIFWSDKNRKSINGESVKRRSFLTIHVKGVGIRLPRPSNDQEAEKERIEGERKKKEDAIMEARKEKEEQEERLRILLQSPQTTPALPSLGSPSETYTFSSLQSGSSRSQPSSPFNSNQDGNQVKASSSRLPTPSSFNYRTMPLYFLYVSKLYLQLHWLPRIKSLFLKASRSAFYLTASALPMLASLVDIEIERMEIYHQESEAVLRVGRIHGDFSMALVTQKGKDGNPCNFSLGDSDLDGREAEDGDENQQAMSQRLSDALYSMSGRIGEGAKGAASYVRTGIPAGKGSLKLSFEGVQIFETSFAKEPTRDSQRKSSTSYGHSISSSTFNDSNLSSASRPQTPSRPSFKNYAKSSRPSSSRGKARNMDTSSSAQWLSGIGPDSSTPPTTPSSPTLKRSNSASMLNAMSTIALSGWTDRWADWALEPDPTSTFSSDTGWGTKGLSSNRTKGLGGLKKFSTSTSSSSHATIPQQARLLSIPNVTSLEMSVLLGPSFSVQNEAVQVGIRIPKVNVGMDAVMQVLGVIEKRRQQRMKSGMKREEFESQGESLEEKKDDLR